MCIMRLLDVGGTNLAQWRHKMPIYYGWRWRGMLTTERQQYSGNPGGTPQQCISVCPWKLAQPIAGYRRSSILILNPQWQKMAACSLFIFIFVLALFAKYLILFSRITGIRHLTWLDRRRLSGVCVGGGGGKRVVWSRNLCKTEHLRRNGSNVFSNWQISKFGDYYLTEPR